MPPLAPARILAVIVCGCLAASLAHAQSASKGADAGAAKASVRQDIRWSGETPNPSRTIDAAYLEIEAATAARDEADRRLREAIVPQPGEAIRQADGGVRYMRSYYDRIAPFERAQMLAAERLERANENLKTAK